MSDAVWVISDDEDSPPPKKMKVYENDKKSPENVNPDRSNDIITINSEDEEEVNVPVTNQSEKKLETNLFYIVYHNDEKLLDKKPVKSKSDNISVEAVLKNENQVDNIEKNCHERSSENDCEIVEVIEDLKENFENINVATKIENQTPDMCINLNISHLNGTSAEEQKNDCNELDQTTANASNGGNIEKLSEITENIENITEKRENSVENCDSPLIQSEKLLENFLEACTSSRIERKLRIVILSKIETIKTRFKNARMDYVESNDFKNLVLKKTKHVKKKPRDAGICFREILLELNFHKKRDISLTGKQSEHIKKLEKTMRKIDKKIKELEAQEVDWDDDNDSSYIQLERYKARFVVVHKKYCSILKSDQFAGRILHHKLDFNSSKYPEINRAIDKLYQKDKRMPNITEVDKILRKTIKDSKLNLSDIEIDIEVRSMHKSLGNLIQRRRKSELDEVMSGFLGNEQDPAIDDPKLMEQLDQQFTEGKKKLDDVFEMYTKKQLDGENPQVSPDSDDSNLSDSGEEENKELKDQDEGETSKEQKKLIM